MTEESTKARRRGRGGPRARDIMRAKRSAPPAVNPCPPGPVGGQYKPLTDDQIETIYHSALRILEEIGMGKPPGTDRPGL
ncbi:hypothetical protein [Aliamphritea spongicola]|nr:hypothetical protein [Aliamphritea spongicola]